MIGYDHPGYVGWWLINYCSVLVVNHDEKPPLAISKLRSTHVSNTNYNQYQASALKNHQPLSKLPYLNLLWPTNMVVSQIGVPPNHLILIFFSNKPSIFVVPYGFRNTQMTKITGSQTIWRLHQSPQGVAHNCIPRRACWQVLRDREARWEARRHLQRAPLIRAGEVNKCINEYKWYHTFI